jgi:hypothetical protein
MRVSTLWLFAFVGPLFFGTAFSYPSQGQEPSQHRQKVASGPSNDKGGTQASDNQQSPLDKVLESIIKREQNEVATLALYRPIVETYIQELRPDKDMSLLPYHDSYFLGQAELSNGLGRQSLLPKKAGHFSFLNYVIESGFIPEGFLQMIYVDRYHFDRQHYEFQYAGREFLGEVRCLMFDVSPAPKSRQERFKGRIWVEDRDFTIVRFSGVYVPQRTVDSVTAHFDSWRLNVQPGLWLPAYIFSEELKPKQTELPKFKAQTRFWAYNTKVASREEEFSNLFIDSANPVQDESVRESQDRSPLQADREFEREGAENSIDALASAGLIAPEGEVDKVLNTVLNNLIVTNNLNIEPEPHCRVMLTSTIEMFSIGHTIVLSRGLLDVLPDEETLAVMLAQELSDALITKPAITQYAFYDVLQTPTPKALKSFSFKDSREDWTAAGQKTLELLGNSPYRNKLANTALFLQQLNRESKLLPHLISPNLGNRVFPVAELLTSGPVLEPLKLDQIAALPMGARIKLDPWSDQIELIKSKAVALQSPRDKMPFEVTPFMPYLTHFQVVNVSVKSNDNAPATTEPPQPAENK